MHMSKLILCIMEESVGSASLSGTLLSHYQQSSSRRRVVTSVSDQASGWKGVERKFTEYGRLITIALVVNKEIENFFNCLRMTDNSGGRRLEHNGGVETAYLKSH